MDMESELLGFAVRTLGDFICGLLEIHWRFIATCSNRIVWEGFEGSKAIIARLPTPTFSVNARM